MDKVGKLAAALRVEYGKISDKIAFGADEMSKFIGETMIVWRLRAEVLQKCIAQTYGNKEYSAIPTDSQVIFDAINKRNEMIVQKTLKISSNEEKIKAFKDELAKEAKRKDDLHRLHADRVNLKENKNIVQPENPLPVMDPVASQKVKDYEAAVAKKVKDDAAQKVKDDAAATKKVIDDAAAAKKAKDTAAAEEGCSTMSKIFIGVGSLVVVILAIVAGLFICKRHTATTEPDVENKKKPRN